MSKVTPQQLAKDTYSGKAKYRPVTIVVNPDGSLEGWIDKWGNAAEDYVEIRYTETGEIVYEPRDGCGPWVTIKYKKVK